MNNAIWEAEAKEYIESLPSSMNEWQAQDIIKAYVAACENKHANNCNIAADAIEKMAEEFITDAWPEHKGKFHWMIGYAYKIRNPGLVVT